LVWRKKGRGRSLQLLGGSPKLRPREWGEGTEGTVWGEGSGSPKEHEWHVGTVVAARTKENVDHKLTKHRGRGGAGPSNYKKGGCSWWGGGGGRGE